MALYDKEDVKGKVIVSLGAPKIFEHKGIKLELIGVIENLKEKKDTQKFLNLTNELSPIGILTNESTPFTFTFPSVQKPYETYKGTMVNVRYYLKVTISTKFRSAEYEQEFAVIRPDYPDILKQENQPIRLEVGIEDWLHLVFDVDSRNFGLKDIIKGRVTFKKVSIRMKSMEIQIIKKESVSTQNVEPITTTITKYEIMDGGPIKNETIPIRFFLKPYDLTPTFKSINNKFSVQYFINLVLTDVEDRKYFKQHEIFMFRIDKNKKPPVEEGKNFYQNFLGMAANMMNPNLLLNPNLLNNPSLLNNPNLLLNPNIFNNLQQNQINPNQQPPSQSAPSQPPTAQTPVVTAPPTQSQSVPAPSQPIAPQPGLTAQQQQQLLMNQQMLLNQQMMANMTPQQQQQMLLNQQMLLMGMGGLGGINNQQTGQQSGETKLDA